MVHIHGESGAEGELIRQCPSGIESFEEIKPKLSKYKKTLETKRIDFFHHLLPARIKEKKDVLEYVKKKKKVAEKKWDEKIQNTQKTIKAQDKFWILPFNYIDLFIKKQISKPSEINSLKREIREIVDDIIELEDVPDTIFERENKELENKIHELSNIIDSPDYMGASGELRVLNELKKLNDEFHVVCDVRLSLRDYVTYKGKRNLRSAQIDYVVVGPTGLFLIEVKNWSRSYYKQHSGLSPHQQVDRAGLIAYIKFKSYFSGKAQIKKILAIVQQGIEYNPNYKFVNVKYYKSLVSSIQASHSRISEDTVNSIVNILT